MVFFVPYAFYTMTCFSQTQFTNTMPSLFSFSSTLSYTRPIIVAELSPRHISSFPHAQDTSMHISPILLLHWADSYFSHGPLYDWGDCFLQGKEEEEGRKRKERNVYAVDCGWDYSFRPGFDYRIRSHQKEGDCLTAWHSLGSCVWFGIQHCYLAFLDGSQAGWDREEGSTVSCLLSHFCMLT